MDTNANKLVIQRYIDEVWNANNLAVLDELAADPEPYRTIITQLRIAYPDLHVTLDEIIAEGDDVAFRWTAQGTHELGTHLTWTGISFKHIRDGKMVASSFAADRLTLLEQLGIVPAQLAAPRPPSRVVPTA